MDCISFAILELSTPSMLSSLDESTLTEAGNDFYRRKRKKIKIKTNVGCRVYDVHACVLCLTTKM